jgi:hypothetical protein
MKLDISGKVVDARLAYVAADDRLVLRTEFVFLAPDTLEPLGIRLLEATEFEVELLKVVGYSRLVTRRSVPS